MVRKRVRCEKIAEGALERGSADYRERGEYRESKREKRQL